VDLGIRGKRAIVVGRLEELGGTVAFLASRRAGFPTGQLPQLDGGMTRSLT
jgi:3-oxoacyl-[acyl-carrier protein] reductase